MGVIWCEYGVLGVLVSAALVVGVGVFGVCGKRWVVSVVGVFGTLLGFEITGFLGGGCCVFAWWFLVGGLLFLVFPACLWCLSRWGGCCGCVGVVG